MVSIFFFLKSKLNSCKGLSFLLLLFTFLRIDKWIILILWHNYKLHISCEVLLNSFYVSDSFKMSWQYCRSLRVWLNVLIIFNQNTPVKQNKIIILLLAKSLTVLQSPFTSQILFINIFLNTPVRLATFNSLRSILRPSTQTLQWIFASKNYFLLPHSYNCSYPTLVRGLLSLSCLGFCFKSLPGFLGWVPHFCWFDFL